MNKDNLKQVIINLMLNAIDAMDDVSEKTIFIETKKEDNSVLLTIKDTGIGIKTEEIGKIFDPFFTTKETGSGIGLSLVFRIMEAVGGSVSVESQEGKGTAVSLKLPMLK